MTKLIPVKMIKFATAVNVAGKSEMFLQAERDQRLRIFFNQEKDLFIIVHSEMKEVPVVFPTNVSHVIFSKEYLKELISSEEPKEMDGDRLQEPAERIVRRGRPRASETQQAQE